MRRIRRIVLGFLLTLFVGGVAFASLFGEESAILSKILLEDIQQTFKLEKMIMFAANELKVLNQKYGFEKWINKGLDEVKDYGLLKELKTDDYILGTFQKDLGDIGFSYKGKEYNFDNINNWVDQVWDTSPTILNTKTHLRSAVNRENAKLAYQHFYYNVEFNEKIRQRYEQLMKEATNANPGKASRLTAQTNVLQNLQLAQINDTQSNILKLMAMKQLEHQQNEDVKRFDLKQGFKGVLHIMASVPTLGR